MTNTSDEHGPKHQIDVEGRLLPWTGETITMEQIVSLGGWDLSQGAVVIDLQTQVETPLAPQQIIEIKPGMGFSKKIRFKRGDDASERVELELSMLRGRFPEMGYVDQGRWVRVPALAIGKAGWNRANTDVVFQVPSGYPATLPYGIYVPVGIRFNGTVPASYVEPAPTQPPFEGQWAFFSWTSEEWRPALTPQTGSNLINWVTGFAQRFAEGA